MRRTTTGATSADQHDQSASALQTMRRVLPYLWPKDEAWVKRRVVGALLMLVLAKVISVCTPFMYKQAVDALAGETPDTGTLLALTAVGLTIAYGVARLGTVAFGELRDVIFVRVGQRALRKLALETFTHIHRLSMRYHITRKTGGLSRIIERGVKGVDFLLRFMLLSIGPLILELTMVSVLFAFLFGWQYMAVVVVTITLYVIFTFRVTEWRVQIRRQMNDQDTDANQKAIDSLLNYETVKYFNAEGREAARYDRAMAAYEVLAVRTGQSLSFLNVGQSAIITTGLVIVMVMAAMGVQQKILTVGDFVMVNAYMIQITMPLNFLGTVYREIRQALVDMGEMFGLLSQPAEVKDKPSAPALQVTSGEIEFRDVVFGYDPNRGILKGVSLHVSPGQRIALVGPSGSGKSTIGRLLFRFYDVNAGSIRIDGHDIREVTQTSLHQSIGVGPQDTVRPLRKTPPILILDEATSALDTQTERDIQESLREMGQGRSVITIAHRLSTIADADQILVLEDGQVTESGTHEVLLAKGGKYAAMWERQSAEEADQAA